jgi:hypothetical protein
MNNWLILRRTRCERRSAQIELVIQQDMQEYKGARELKVTRELVHRWWFKLTMMNRCRLKPWSRSNQSSTRTCNALSRRSTF